MYRPKYIHSHLLALQQPRPITGFVHIQLEVLGLCQNFACIWYHSGLQEPGSRRWKLESSNDSQFVRELHSGKWCRASRALPTRCWSLETQHLYTSRYSYGSRWQGVFQAIVLDVDHNLPSCLEINYRLFLVWHLTFSVLITLDHRCIRLYTFVTDTERQYFPRGGTYRAEPFPKVAQHVKKKPLIDTTVARLNRGYQISLNFTHTSNVCPWHTALEKCWTNYPCSR